jgi:hypothetical protein
MSAGAPQDESRTRRIGFEIEVITMFWTPEGLQAEVGYRYEQLRKAAVASRLRAGRARHGGGEPGPTVHSHHWHLLRRSRAK